MTRFRLAAICATLALVPTVGARTASDAVPRPHDLAAVHIPVAFERNEGQFRSDALYMASGPGYHVALHRAASPVVATFDAGGAGIGMELRGALRDAAIVHSSPLHYPTSYFRGQGATRHVRNVASFGKVTYRSVYPGIDLVYHADNGRVEYDFIVAPGSDPDQIRMRFRGANGATVRDDGSLLLRSGASEIAFKPPTAYQEKAGRRVSVPASYEFADSGEMGFSVGPYDRRAPLVIDPILAYSSYVWGAVEDVAVDSEGNVYLAGFTTANDLPDGPGHQSKQLGTSDAFVIKLGPGGQVRYRSYLGARSAQTFGRAVAVDAAGNAYLVGTTNGKRFPTTSGAYQTVYADGASFIAKFTATGTVLEYSTFVNGANLRAISVDSGGSAHAVGAATTTSPFVTTPLAYQTTPGGGVALRLNPAGSAATYATYIGGGTASCADVALDGSGSAVIVGTTGSNGMPLVNPVQPGRAGGRDAFAIKLNPSGTAALLSTYLGGSQDEYGTSVATDAAGDLYLTGRTFSSDFPVTFAAFQPAKGHSDPVVSNAFVTKIPANGSALAYSSYLGGRWCLTAGVFSCFALFPDNEGIDGGTSIAVDAAGFAYVGGYANSVEFPRVDSLHGNIGPTGENERAPFIAKVNPGGDRLIYSSVFGTRGVGPKLDALTLGPNGILHAVGLGCCGVTDRFPLTAAAPLSSSSNSFLVTLGPSRYPTTLTSSANPVADGQPVTLRAEVENPGVVTFSSGATALGTAAASNGAAVLTVLLPRGVHEVRAVNDADGVVSPPVYQMVTAP